MKKLLILVVFCITYSYSQTPAVKEFLINGEESSPSAFTQGNPKLTLTNSNNFIVSWTDNRDGDNSTYAQRYNGNGGKVGNNFRITANDNAYINKNGYLLAINDTYFENILYSSFQTDGILYSPDGQVVSISNLFGGIYPWCGTGFIGGERLVTASDNCFYFLTNYSGLLSLSKIEETGELKSLYSSTSEISASQITSAATNNCNYLFAWFKGGESYEDSLKTGLYATFIDANDSIIKLNLQLFEVNNESGDYYYFDSYRIKAVALNDSTYKLFWINADSLSLNAVKFNTRGEIISAIETIMLPGIEGESRVGNITLTNKSEETFYLYITTIKKDIYPTEYVNSFIEFDINGNQAGSITRTKNDIFSSGNFFNAGNGKFFFPSTDYNDVFINQSDFFSVNETTKINDDSSGSNEINAAITNYDNNSVFSLWKNEVSYWGTRIDKDGNLPGEKVNLSGNNILFFPDKEAISLWVKQTNDNRFYSGYTIYDSDLHEKLSKVLYLGGNALISQPHVSILSDSLFIVLINEERELKLIKESKTGQTLADKIIEKDVFINLDTEELFLRDAGSLWVSWNNNIQLYSTDLEAKSSVKYLPGLNSYIGSDRFLTFKYEYTSINGISVATGKIYGIIVNSELDTLKSEILLRDLSNNGGSLYYSTNDLFIKTFQGDKFLAITKYDNKYYVRPFSNDGIALKGSFPVTPASSLPISNINVTFNNGKVYFTWSGTKNAGKGYDIYGSIFNLSSITDVKELPFEVPQNYSLSQNYPNPFNPATQIRFSVPEYSHVLIKIYDILGNEIAVVVNEGKPAGTYETVFNGSNLSSGIYFCKMVVSGYSETRKMVLLK